MRPHTHLLAGSAVLLSALSAHAQSVTVILTHDDPDGIVWVADTVTWSLLIAFDGFPDWSAASSGNMEILGDNSLVQSSHMSYGHVNGGNNGGLSNGAGIGFVSWTNSLFLGQFGEILADLSNPYLVGTFQTTALSPGTLTYSFTRGIANSAFVLIDENVFYSFGFEIHEVAFNIDSLTIVPAPASALLLAPAALLAGMGRRRR